MTAEGSFPTRGTVGLTRRVPGGTLIMGSPFHPREYPPKSVRVAEFVSLGKNSPFDGFNLKGWPVATIVGGRLVMQDGRLLV